MDVKALILAAGFGTRLTKGLDEYRGPQQELVTAWIAGKPKGLVQVCGRPLLDYQFEQMQAAGIGADNIYIYTNAKYHDQFVQWAQTVGIPTHQVLNNGVKEAPGLGSLVDFRRAVKEIGTQSPLLFLASDTLLYDQQGLYDFGKLVNGYCLDQSTRIVTYEGQQSRLSKHGILEIYQNTLVGFEEKPTHPKSAWVNASVHLYSPAALLAIQSSRVDNCSNVLEVLWQDFDIKVSKAVRRLDLGTIEDVLAANGLEVANPAQNRTS